MCVALKEGPQTTTDHKKTTGEMYRYIRMPQDQKNCKKITKMPHARKNVKMPQARKQYENARCQKQIKMPDADKPQEGSETPYVPEARWRIYYNLLLFLFIMYLLFPLTPIPE